MYQTVCFTRRAVVLLIEPIVFLFVCLFFDVFVAIAFRVAWAPHLRARKITVGYSGRALMLGGLIPRFHVFSPTPRLSLSLCLSLPLSLSLSPFLCCQEFISLSKYWMNIEILNLLVTLIVPFYPIPCGKNIIVATISLFPDKLNIKTPFYCFEQMFLSPLLFFTWIGSVSLVSFGKILHNLCLMLTF